MKNINMRTRISYIPLLVTLLLGIHSKAEECGESPNLMFTRTYVTTCNGPSTFGSTKDSFTKAVGDCHGMDEFSDGMVKFYESYGFDMTNVKRDPLGFYENSDFIISPVITPEKGICLVRLETFYEYAKYRDTILIFASWSMIAKTNHTGPRGQFSAGHYGLYGVSRFKVHGREFCFDFHSRIPLSSFILTGPSPHDLVTYNKYFGRGASRGIVINNGTWTVLQAVMSMPAEPLNSGL